MADHFPHSTNFHRHSTEGWLSCRRIYLAPLTVAALLLAMATTFLAADKAWAAPFKTGDDVADSVLPQEEDTSKRPEVEEAIKKLNNQDVAGALESLEAASAKYPDLAPGRVILAQIYIRSGSAAAVQQAHALLDQSVIDHPDDPEAYMTLGALAIRSHLMTEAQLLFERGTELAENFKGDEKRLKRVRTQSASGLASLAEAKGDWETAAKHLREMIALSDDNFSAHQRLGQALFMMGSSANREEAYKEYTQAAKLNDKLAKPEVAMGALYARDDKEGSDKKALEWFNYAVEQHPEDVTTRIQVAMYLLNIGDAQGALQHAEKALELDPDSNDARMALGQVDRYLGKYEAAQGLFEAVYVEAPTNFNAVNLLALSLADQDDPAKRQRALELMNIVFKNMDQNDPNRAEAVATIGWIYHQLNDAANAEKALAAAVNSRRVGPDALYHLARVYAKKGDNAQAKVYLEMAVKKDGSLFIYRNDAEKMLAEM